MRKTLLAGEASMQLLCLSHFDLVAALTVCCQAYIVGRR